MTFIVPPPLLYFSVKMKSIDAYFMGHYLLTKHQYYEAGFWLYSALMKYKTNEFNRIVDYGKEKPFELYAETLMHQSMWLEKQGSIVFEIYS